MDFLPFRWPISMSFREKRKSFLFSCCHGDEIAQKPKKKNVLLEMMSSGWLPTHRQPNIQVEIERQRKRKEQTGYFFFFSTFFVFWRKKKGEWAKRAAEMSRLMIFGLLPIECTHIANLLARRDAQHARRSRKWTAALSFCVAIRWNPVRQKKTMSFIFLHRMMLHSFPFQNTTFTFTIFLVSSWKLIDRAYPRS